MPSPRKPRIGITYSYKPEEAGQINDNVAAYVRAVEEAGGEPVLLLNEVERVDEYLAARVQRSTQSNDGRSAGASRGAVDGLILSGGIDVDPKRYGQPKHTKTQIASAAREEFEIELVRAARDRWLPSLCICRGLQVANVAFGGTLIQDLPSEFGDRYDGLHHQQVKEDGCERDDVLPGHEVQVAENSALARLVGTTRFAANSMHHQAVRTVAPDLRAVAWTPDGVIEALDATFEHPFFFAVQWHPEELDDDPVSRALFGGLIAASRNCFVKGTERQPS